MLYLFDIDGTLIGGDGAGRRAFERACNEHIGVERALGEIRLDGMTDRLILAAVFDAHAKRPPTEAEATAILNRYVEHLRVEMQSCAYHVKPAVQETLAHLEAREAVIGLATGNLRHGAQIKLERGELWHRFPFGGFGCDATARAELVKVAIERGLQRVRRAPRREEIIVIGDTPKDIDAAHAAGATAVALATGSFSVDQLREAGADAVFPTMGEWLETL